MWKQRYKGEAQGFTREMSRLIFHWVMPMIYHYVTGPDVSSILCLHTGISQHADCYEGSQPNSSSLCLTPLLLPVSQAQHCLLLSTCLFRQDCLLKPSFLLISIAEAAMPSLEASRKGNLDFSPGTLRIWLSDVGVHAQVPLSFQGCGHCGKRAGLGPFYVSFPLFLWR